MNLFNELSNILKSEPLEFGKCISVNDKTATIQGISNELRLCTYDNAPIVGKHYYHKSGKIESEAPDFEITEIVIKD